MKCKLSSYVVKHNLTTLKYNNISQVCPYKDLGSAKDYVIILLLLMQLETPIPCTDIPKLERKEDSGNKTNLVRMSMFIPEKTNTSAKLDIIKILKKQFNFSLNQTKEYVDSCIGKYSILPSAILQTEVDEVTKKLEPYSVIISTAGFY